MTTQGIPPETIKVGILHEQILNPMREYYNQGWNDCVIKAQEILAERMGKVKKMLEDVSSDVKSEPPNQTVVQAGTDLVDNAMLKLLNPICPHCQCGIGHVDYLTIGMIEKWLKGKGSPYLAALVNAVLEAQR